MFKKIHRVSEDKLLGYKTSFGKIIGLEEYSDYKGNQNRGAHFDLIMVESDEDNGKLKDCPYSRKILQGYEEFRKVRKTRIDLVSSFKADMNEVKALISQLKKTLPKVTLRIKKAEVERSTPVSRKVDDRELRKLEDELSDIESKLGDLS